MNINWWIFFKNEREVNFLQLQVSTTNIGAEGRGGFYDQSRKAKHQHRFPLKTSIKNQNGKDSQIVIKLSLVA